MTIEDILLPWCVVFNGKDITIVHKGGLPFNVGVVFPECIRNKVDTCNRPILVSISRCEECKDVLIIVPESERVEYLDKLKCTEYGSNGELINGKHGEDIGNINITVILVKYETVCRINCDSVDCKSGYHITGVLKSCI